MIVFRDSAYTALSIGSGESNDESASTHGYRTVHAVNVNGSEVPSSSVLPTAAAGRVVGAASPVMVSSPYRKSMYSWCSNTTVFVASLPEEEEEEEEEDAVHVFSKMLPVRMGTLTV